MKGRGYYAGSDGFERVGVNLDGGRLVNEVQPQQHGGPAVTLLDPAFDALQRSGLDAHAHSLADGGCQTHPHFRLQGQKDVLQLPLKSLLIEHIEQVRHMIVLAQIIFLSGLQLNKDIARKERLLEHDRLASILVRRTAAGQCRGDVLALAMLNNFLLSSRLGMGHEPKQV